MWNVMFGRSVVVGGLALGVERDEQASVDRDAKEKISHNPVHR